MCGIIGIVGKRPVNQSIYDGLTVLQHRGQDAAGIMTSDHGRLHLRKDNGLVRDVFEARHMLRLPGNVGIGHVRYPTAGSSSSAEAQPFYVNSPYGIALAHNGNLTNAGELKDEVFRDDPAPHQHHLRFRNPAQRLRPRTTKINGYGPGVFLREDSNNNRIVNNVIYGGLVLYKSYDNLISENLFVYAPFGIILEEESNDNIISNNTFDGNGLLVGYSENPLFTAFTKNNRIENNMELVLIVME